MSEPSKAHVLAPGDRVTHWKFGPGTVISLGATEKNEPMATVRFDADARERRLLLALAGLQWLDPDDPVSQHRNSQAFFDETFLVEDADAEHSMGSHWDAFIDGSAKAALLNLPKWIELALVQTGYGDNFHGPFVPPGGWPKAFLLSYPIRNEGAQMLIAVGDTGNQFTSMFPFSAIGSQHTVKIEQVHVWSSGLEAQIECRLGPTHVSFYDTCHVMDRAWYRAGETYDFVLCGMAYSCKRAKTQQFDVQHSPEVMAGLSRHGVLDQFGGADGLMKVSTEGMAALLPIAAWDRDDYEFRGPVTAVKKTILLDRLAWRLRVTVLRNGEQDVDLEVLVTDRIWQSESEPAIGEDVEGRLWLQGRLWYPHRQNALNALRPS